MNRLTVIDTDGRTDKKLKLADLRSTSNNIQYKLYFYINFCKIGLTYLIIDCIDRGNHYTNVGYA